MLFNPAFYRGMPAEAFDVSESTGLFVFLPPYFTSTHRRYLRHSFQLIRRKDSRDYIPLAKQLRMAGKIPGKKKEKQAVKKKTTAKATAAAKKKKSKASNTGANLPPPPAGYVVAKSGKKVSAKASDKKRKGGTQADVPETSRPKKKKKLSAEAAKAQKKLDDYRHLHGMYDAWSLFHIPADLKSHVKKKKVMNTSGYVAREGVESIREDAKFLICEETMPDWLAQDDKETLKELEEMIIRDRRQRQLRQDAWSRKYSVAKGKTLPRSKFNKPTNKWQKVTPGDRIDVFWADDQKYYTAKVIKNQEGTTYFHLFYEDDGATEWLDLSREDFNLLGNDTLAAEAASSSVGGPSDTPRKDNRSLPPQRPSLPDNHAHLAPFLRYAWDRVKLGEENGTPAYNKFITASDPSATPVTPLEVLQDVRALRMRGFVAQPNVAHLVTNAADDGRNTKLKMALRELQEDISQDHDALKGAEHFEETLSTVRRVTDHWNVHTLIGNMQKMETRVSALDEREARILEKLRKKKII